MDPAIFDQLPHSGQRRGRADDRFRRGLDDHEQPQRFVDLDRLPWQPGPQVAGLAVHHADQACDVVGEFRVAAVAQPVNRREEIGEVDPGRHRTHGRERSGEDPTVVVRGRIVGDQKRPAVEKQSAGPRPPADDGRGVRGVAEFRTDLREVNRPRLHVFARLPWRDVEGRGFEPTAPLVRVGDACLITGPPQLVDITAMALWQAVRIEPGDGVGAGIEDAADESGVVGNGQPFVREPAAHAVVVGHHGEGAGVGSARPTATGAAVVGAFVGIVEAGRAMPDHGDESRQSRGQADVFEHAADDHHHLVHVETGVGAVRQKVFPLALQGQPGGHPAAGEFGGGPPQPGRQPWKGDAGHQWHRSHRTREGGEQSAAKERATAGGNTAGELPHPPSQVAMEFMERLRPIFRQLDDGVPGPHHDRTQRRRMPVVDAAVIHGHAKEAGGAEGFEALSELLEMPAERLAPFIHAEHRLKQRPRCRCRRGEADMRRQSVERLDLVATLVGEMEEPAPREAVEGGDGMLEPEQFVLVEPADVVGCQSEQLRHLMEQKGPRQAARAASGRIAVAKFRPETLQMAAWRHRGSAARSVAVVCEVFVVREAKLPGSPVHGNPIADEPQGHEIDEPGGDRFDRCAVGPLFEMPDHPGPSPQGQCRAGQILVPVGLRHAQSVEFGGNHIDRMAAACGPERCRQAGTPRLRRTEATGIDAGHRLEQPPLAARHRPCSDPLIEKSRAESNQQRVHEVVGVERRIDRQDEIAVPHRRSGVRDRGTGQGDRLDAGMPEFTRRALFHAGLPSLGTGKKHRPPRRLVVAVGQSGVLVFDAVFAAIAEQSPTGLGAQVVAEPFDDILLGERPADGGIVLLPHRMEQECQPQIPQ